VGLPFGGVWDEVVNTDAEEYGGSGVGNFGSVTASDEHWWGRPASVELTLPPLGALFLTPRRESAGAAASEPTLEALDTSSEPDGGTEAA
jgi:hypothetical protein